MFSVFTVGSMELAIVKAEPQLGLGWTHVLRRPSTAASSTDNIRTRATHTFPGAPVECNTGDVEQVRDTCGTIQR